MADFKVLFIDDERNLLRSFIRIFLNEPVQIFTAENAMEALEHVSSNDFDLIVTDIKMPGMHGLELIEEIRKEGSSAPVIVYSAFSGMKEDCIIKTHNIKSYYSKPDDYELLCNKIKELAYSKSASIQ